MSNNQIGQVFNGRQQFIDGNGRPLAGGRVSHYLPNTLTPVTTYQDDDFTVQNTNPIVLDAAGMATIYAVQPRLRQIVTTIDGTLVWDKETGSSPDLSSASVVMENIQALRDSTVPYGTVYVQGYYSINDGGEGMFYAVPSDTTSLDDGGSIIIDDVGLRYYRHMEDRSQISVRWWGAVGNEIADDATAIQACFTYCQTNGLVPYVPPGSFRTTVALTLNEDAAGLTMDGTIRPVGGFVGLTVGASGTDVARNKVYVVRVHRMTVSDWLSESDVGVRLQNCDSCVITVIQAEGFTIGLQTFGDERGFEDTTITLGRLVDNKYGLDVRTNTASAWNNSVRYIGGHFACSSGINTGADRYGVRFSAAPGAYELHNTHLFLGPAFELQNQGNSTTPNAIPFLMSVSGRSVTARDIRMEGCSIYVARHTQPMNDCIYEVAYASNGSAPGVVGDAYQVSVLYDAGVNRAGGSVVPHHQAAAALTSYKLVADGANIRSRAFRWSSTEIGFEEMCVVSGNPAGPPTTLTGFAFPGLSLLTLNTDSITMPTSRGVGFVVYTESCQEFQIAFEGSTLRPFIMQFDASENVLDSNSPAILSNQSLVWNASAWWWESSADSEDATNTLLQRVTLHSNCRFAIIGLRSSNVASVLRSLRLYCPTRYSPQILYGGARNWGTREFIASANYDPPSLAAGASASVDLTVTNARQGDYAQGSFAADAGFQAGSVVTHAMVGPVDTVRVTFFNYSGGAVDLGAGTVVAGNGVFARVVKPRL